MTQLEPYIQALIDRLEGLRAELETESHLLTRGNADDLPDLIGRKVPVLAEIARLWQGLAQGLGLAGDVSADVLGERIAAMGDARITRLWSDAESRAREVGRLNAVNGKLIREQMRHNHAALQILQDATRHGGLYGADGQSLGVFSRHRMIDEV
ncbi:MAG TPA: flagellar protein FlgN [Thiobacillaceae bacterium]|nr:flagellar protein FlgN [Thiobacillaceae bacterium]